jgi:hypothetical protein
MRAVAVVVVPGVRVESAERPGARDERIGSVASDHIQIWMIHVHARVDDSDVHIQFGVYAIDGRRGVLVGVDAVDAGGQVLRGGGDQAVGLHQQDVGIVSQGVGGSIGDVGGEALKGPPENQIGGEAVTLAQEGGVAGGVPSFPQNDDVAAWNDITRPGILRTGESIGATVSAPAHRHRL